MGIEDRDYFQQDRARRERLPHPSRARHDGPAVKLPASAYRRQPAKAKDRLPELGAWLAWIVIGVAVFLVVVFLGLAKP